MSSTIFSVNNTLCNHFLAKLASGFRDQVIFIQGDKAGENKIKKGLWNKASLIL